MLTEFRHNRANSALRKALLANDSDALLKAIRKGADPNTTVGNDSNGNVGGEDYSALSWALSHGQDSCLKLLLDAGAALPDTPEQQAQLLQTAICSTNTALTLLTLVLQAGISPDVCQGSAFFYCLEVADDNQKQLLLTRLIEHGGDINSSNAQGDTPLALLMQQERLELVGTLITAGAELPENIDGLNCSDEMKAFARRKQQDLQARRLLLGLD